MSMKQLSSSFFLLFLTLSLTACKEEPKQIAIEGKTMGTSYHVKYIDDGSIAVLPTPDQVKTELDELLKQVNNEMSTYQKDSVISEFNRSRNTELQMKISNDFATVVKEAIRLNKVTLGALDVTVGPLVNLWGFGPDKKVNLIPTDEQIAERRQWVGINKLKLQFVNDDPQSEGLLSKSEANLYLDLSAIAKGFGVDKLAHYFDQLGVENYLVEIGGEIYGKGKNIQGKFWQISIEKPEFEQGVASQITIPLNQSGIATSGNYRNYFKDEQGNRLSHIIDPKTSRPISHNLASITVLADSAMTADGLSTGLFVLGAEKALEIAEKNKLAVFLIIEEDNGYHTLMSSEFKKITEQQ